MREPMQTTPASELVSNKTASGKKIGELIKSTPYVPPASVSVPPSSSPQTPPIPTGAGE